MSEDCSERIERQGPSLVLLVRGWVRPAEEAESLVQKVVVRFWPRRHFMDDPSSYLCASVRRAAMDRAYRDATMKKKPASTLLREESSPLLFCSKEFDERRKHVEQILDALPEEQREVVVMKIWIELTFQQIARVLGVPSVIAASRWREGMSCFRTLCDDDDAANDEGSSVTENDENSKNRITALETVLRSIQPIRTCRLTAPVIEQVRKARIRVRGIMRVVLSLGSLIAGAIIAKLVLQPMFP